MSVHALRQPMKYEFTNDWFSTTADIPQWEAIFTQLKPKRCLELGSFEGRSAVFMLERLPEGGSLTCVDTWEGGADLSPDEMKGAEERFDRNTATALGARSSPVTFLKRKELSVQALADMIVRRNQFDLIYIDASHTAPDVLTDAVMAFRLLAPKGIMIFDDYYWTTKDRGDVLNAPAIAIDMFATIFTRSLRTIVISGQRIFQEEA